MDTSRETPWIFVDLHRGPEGSYEATATEITPVAGCYVRAVSDEGYRQAVSRLREGLAYLGVSGVMAINVEFDPEAELTRFSEEERAVTARTGT